MCHKDLFGFFPSHHYIPETYNIVVTHKILVGCPNDKKSRYSLNSFHPPTRLTLPPLSLGSVHPFLGWASSQRPATPTFTAEIPTGLEGWIVSLSPKDKLTSGNKTKPETFQARLSCWVKGPDWALRETQVRQTAVWAGSNYLQIGVCRFDSAGGLELGLTLGQKK